MKKILLSILGILIGFVGFSSADCTQYYDLYDTYCYKNFSSFCTRNGWTAKYYLGYKFSIDGEYSINSISYYNLNNNSNDSLTIKYCLSNDSGSSILVNCIDISSYTINYDSSTNLNTISFPSIVFDSTVNHFVLFQITGFNGSIYYSRQGDFYNFDSVVEFIPKWSTLSVDSERFLIPGNICYSSLSIPKFTVNYGNQSKDYTMDQDIDIYINGPVSKNGNIFTYDGSTGINLVYNGQYNFYTKNKLYLDGQFWYRQGVFTPICL